MIRTQALLRLCSLQAEAYPHSIPHKGACVQRPVNSCLEDRLAFDFHLGLERLEGPFIRAAPSLQAQAYRTGEVFF